MVTDLTIGNPTTISFTYGNGIWIKRVNVSERPGDPGNYRNISKYINASDLTANSWLFLNFSYSDSDLAGVDETTLSVWKYNGTAWNEEGWNGSRVLDTVNNVVGVNITDFCIFAPRGNPFPPAITSFAPPSPVNDTVCTWRTFNVSVNQTVNVSWYLNESLLFTNETVTEANCTLHAAWPGEHNVSAIATNQNGTATQMWIWNVTGLTSVAIPTATETDNVTINISSGYFCDIPEALKASDFPGGLPDSVLTFPYGFFNFTICWLNDTISETVTINFTFPSAIPTDAEFWKYNSTDGT